MSHSRVSELLPFVKLSDRFVTKSTEKSSKSNKYVDKLYNPLMADEVFNKVEIEEPDEAPIQTTNNKKNVYNIY